MFQLVSRHIKKCQKALGSAAVEGASKLAVVKELQITMDLMALACK